MRTDKLQWLLEAAARSGIRQFSLDPETEKWAPVAAYIRKQAVDADPRIGRAVCELLLQDPEMRAMTGKTIWTGQGGGNFQVEGLWRTLLYRTLVKGPCQAARDLERYLRSESNPGVFVMTIRGLSVDRPLRISPGLALVPIRSMPPSHLKVEIENPGILGTSSPHTTPHSALVARAPSAPKFLPEGGVPNDRPNWYGRMAEFCLWLTLLGSTSPKDMHSIWQWEGWVPMPAYGGSSSRPLEPRVFPPHVLCDSERDEVRRIFSLWSRTSLQTRDRLRTPIRRINSALEQVNSVDRAVDLGIGLESLLLEGTKSGELRHRFSLRGAWLLGRDATEREALARTLKAVYDCRSVAVHSDRLPKKAGGEPPEDILTQGVSLAVRIVKVLADKGFPDWDALVLGGTP